MIIYLIILCGFLAFCLYYIPDLIPSVLFAFIIANVNFELPGLPLNFKALFTLLTYGILISEKKIRARYSPYLMQPVSIHLMIFISYGLLMSFGNETLTIDLIKASFTTLLATYCIYHCFFKNYNSNNLKTAVYIAGLICFADLMYTYLAFGNFPVRRIQFMYLGNQTEIEEDNILLGTNHNFYGQICGLSFIFLLTNLLSNQKSSFFNIIYLPMMFMGIILSTSRSALFSSIIISFVMIVLNWRRKKRRKNIKQFLYFGAIALVVTLFFATNLTTIFKLDSNFADEIIFKLTKEPVAIFKRLTGQNYNINNLGSMNWREESSEIAYNAYLNLSTIEQTFGIGVGGFILRNLGDGYNAHNGILLLLIEFGIVGFIIYLTMILSVILRAITLANFSPSFAALVFMIAFGIGHNNELTSPQTLFFLISIASENIYLKNSKPYINTNSSNKSRFSQLNYPL